VPGSDRLGTFKRKLRWSPLLPGSRPRDWLVGLYHIPWNDMENPSMDTSVSVVCLSPVEINKLSYNILLIYSKLQESTHHGKNFGTCQTYPCWNLETMTLGCSWMHQWINVFQSWGNCLGRGYLALLYIPSFPGKVVTIFSESKACFWFDPYPLIFVIFAPDFCWWTSTWFNL
jgi:hypothetical protein